MKKILIWYVNELTNTGGPRGYLYNIHEYLKDHPNDQITFLTDIITPYKTKPVTTKNSRNIWWRIIEDLKQILNYTWRRYKYNIHEIREEQICGFDIIHIHGITEYYRFKNKFKYYPGKVVLTNHSPCPWAYEEMERYDKFVNLFRFVAVKKECEAYTGADYLLFPCKGAREPYEVDAAIKKVFKKNECKFIYVPSSILDVKLDLKKIQKYSDFGIPSNSFVITFFGRHNEIKGYDILKRVGERLLDSYPNLYFLCAGKGNIDPFSHPRWIELGFIKNTAELLYQSDLYISANRETYFDLVVLEVLRSGTKALLSSTGGNNYFKDLPVNETMGIDYFDINNLEEIVSKVERCIRNKYENELDYLAFGVSNRKLFLKYFTIEKFVDRYLKELNKIK